MCPIPLSNDGNRPARSPGEFDVAATQAIIDELWLAITRIVGRKPGDMGGMADFLRGQAAWLHALQFLYADKGIVVKQHALDTLLHNTWRHCRLGPIIFVGMACVDALDFLYKMTGRDIRLNWYDWKGHVGEQTPSAGEGG